MNDNINNLVTRILDKEGYFEILSKEFGKSIDTIRTNWISRNKVPDHFYKRAHELALNFVLTEQEKTSLIIQNNKLDEN